MATIEDVAREAGVSISTVSRVINNPEKTKPLTRQKVQAVIESLNYRPNPSAQSFRRSRTGILGLLLPNVEDEFYYGVLAGASREAAALGQTILLAPFYNNLEEEENAIAGLIDKPMDALLYAPRHVGMCLTQIEYFRDIPIVGVSKRTIGFEVPCVYNDNIQAGYQCTKYLISLGRRRIAFDAWTHSSSPIDTREQFEAAARSGHTSTYNYTERFLGYRKALEEAGIPYDSRLVFPNHFSTRKPDGSIAGQVLAVEGVDGALMRNDVAALRLIRALQEQGCRVPEDVSVIGSGDIPWCREFSPSVTTLLIGEEEIGRQAVLAANRMLSGEKPEDVVVETARLVRGSTVKKPGKTP